MIRFGVARPLVTTVLAVDLATDPVVRTFLQEVLKLVGNVPKDVGDFILTKPALPVLIIMAFALFTGMKVHLRNGPVPQRDVLRDAYFIAGIWRFLGKKIVEVRRSVDTYLALLNAVYVGACQPLEQILDERQTHTAARRVPLPQRPCEGKSVISSQSLR